jgi:hypothetical protein
METIQNQGNQRVINLELPFELLPWQEKVENDWHRFNVIGAGRRSGKSLFGVNRCVVKAGTVPGSISWYVAPTYTMAKDIAWAKLKEYLKDFITYGLVRKINDSELYAELITGSIIQLKGSDKPDSLRGVGLDLLVLDEYAVMKKAVWEEVLRPGISDREGDVVFISTPKGYNHFYDVYQKELKDPEWKSWHIKSSEAGIISHKEIEQAKRDMDERAFRQEYEATFETFGGQVFTTFDRKKYAVAEIQFNPSFEYVLGMDFGWTSPNVTLFIQVDSNENVYVFDEMGVTETPIEDVGVEIRERKYERWADQYKRRKTYDPEVIYCDPAGDAKSETTGSSSVQELKKMGFKVRYKDKYPGVVQDRVNQIRKWLKNEKLRISKTCTNLIQAMEMYRYPDPKDNIQSEVPLKDGISDHWIDALGEFFINRFPIKKSFVRAL